MTIKRFNQNQKFRVVSGYACFYATAKEIRNGLGMMGNFNAATQKCLDALEFQRSGTDILACSTGLAGTWEGIPVQLDLA